MLPAKAVRIVLVFFVIRLLKLKDNAVKNDIEVFGFFFLWVFETYILVPWPDTPELYAEPLVVAVPDLSVPSAMSFLSCSSVYGSESSTIVPSRSLTILVEYFIASSGLCVTIIISLSLEISLRSSIICTLVSVSSAPVGSSARRISGLLTSALAMATLCICPPDIWLGFLWICSPSPTFSSASTALFLLSAFDTPDNVSASSTLERTVWCGIRL